LSAEAGIVGERPVFNLANITGRSFAEWKPGGGQQAPVFNRLRAVPAAPEQSTTTNQETDVMGTRSDIRAALSKGRVSYAKLKELLKGQNIATPLSQMASEGTVVRRDEDDGTYYELGRAPGSPRKPRKSKSGAGKSGKRTATRRIGPKPRGKREKAPRATDMHLTPVIAELRARRELLDQAISSLEKLSA
jgi:hypothetical protein